MSILSMYVCRGWIWHGNGFVCLEFWMVSWYKNEIVQAGVSNCMRRCLNVSVLNVHFSYIPGLKGESPFFKTNKFVYYDVYCMNLLELHLDSVVFRFERGGNFLLIQLLAKTTKQTLLCLTFPILSCLFA